MVISDSVKLQNEDRKLISQVIGNQKFTTGDLIKHFSRARAKRMEEDLRICVENGERIYGRQVQKYGENTFKLRD